MQTESATCTETQPPDKAQRVFQPIQPWFKPGELEELAYKQPAMSWEEKVAQINRSLGRPQGSP